MESLSIETLAEICKNEQKARIKNNFILKICKEYHKNKSEVGDFRYSIINEFELHLFSKNIILQKEAKGLIYKKVTNLHSRLVAPTDEIEFEIIAHWNIQCSGNGREITDSKKPHCQYFKDWFITGEINI